MFIPEKELYFEDLHGEPTLASGIQHAMRMRRIVACCLPALKYFSTIHVSHTRQDFRKNKFTERKMCFDFL
jgi:hypothetical protein